MTVTIRHLSVPIPSNTVLPKRLASLSVLKRPLNFLMVLFNSKAFNFTFEYYNFDSFLTVLYRSYLLGRLRTPRNARETIFERIGTGWWRSWHKIVIFNANLLFYFPCTIRQSQLNIVAFKSLITLVWTVIVFLLQSLFEFKKISNYYFSIWSGLMLPFEDLKLNVHTLLN